jgi:hypothetical protein
MRQTYCHLLYNIEKNYSSFSFVTHRRMNVRSSKDIRLRYGFDKEEVWMSMSLSIAIHCRQVGRTATIFYFEVRCANTAKSMQPRGKKMRR